MVNAVCPFLCKTNFAVETVINCRLDLNRLECNVITFYICLDKYVVSNNWMECITICVSDNLIVNNPQCAWHECINVLSLYSEYDS